MRESVAAKPNSALYAWLGLGFIAFAFYASWMPFRFVPLSVQEAVEQFRSVLDEPLRVVSRSDWLANMILLFPAAFCLIGALGVDKPRSGWLGDCLLVLPICFVVSVVLEFGQLFIPGRIASVNDIVAQWMGTVLGALAWLCLGQQMTRWSRQLWNGVDPSTVEMRLLPAYIGVLVVLHLLPLDLTLSPVEVYRKYKAGRINFVPFSFAGVDLFARYQRMLLTVVTCGLLGVMSGGLRGAHRGQGANTSSATALGLAVLLVGFLNFAKLFVASRSFDVTDLLLGITAVATGWWLRGKVFGREGFADRMTEFPVRLGMLGFWMALLLFVTWQPFDVDFSLAAGRLAEMEALPFADFQRGQELHALQNVTEKMVLYLPVGVLLTPWSARPRRFSWLLAGLFALGFAGILEAGQLVLISRTASLSDVYIETLGALLGSLLTRRICVTTWENLGHPAEPEAIS